MEIKKEINKIIDELGITRQKASEIMQISYAVLKQKNSDKSPRHSWNNKNLELLKEFKEKYDKTFGRN